MRIISGKLRGKSIDFVKSKITRPLKDSVKENIFNIISHSNLVTIELNKANILDLYSGVGSFGLECLSRGADKIVFVEKDKDSAEILTKNLNALSLEKRAEVITEDIQQFLKNETSKFDIFFLDPPFSNNIFIEDLKLIKRNKNFQKNHLIIIHREQNTSDDFQKIINPLIIRKYGRSKIIFAKFLD